MLVALAVLSVSLMAALRVSNIATDTALGFHERLLAAWVAENRLAERSIGQGPELGESAGATEQGGISFGWREQVSATDIPGLRRIDVQVHLAGSPEHALVRLAGYARRVP